MMAIALRSQRSFVALGWCLAASAGDIGPHHRVYTLHISPGCEHMHFTLESLNNVLESQRRVWEQFGIERPWWSVLSADQYDAKLILNDDEAHTFYATGEKAVENALTAVDLALSDGTPAARTAALPWAGGGFGSVSPHLTAESDGECVSRQLSILDAALDVSQRRWLPDFTPYCALIIQRTISS